MEKMVNTGRLGVEGTYEFLAIDQPGVDFVEVKDVVTWQLADTIALGKLEETDCTFDLCLAPWYWKGLIVGTGRS